MVKTPAVVLSLLCALSAAAGAASSPDVTLRIDAAGGIQVPVEVDGQGPYTFLLDTGANASVISSDLAARLALPVVAKTSVQTLAGSEDQLVVRLDRMSISSAARTGVLASVMPSSQLERIVGDVDGIVGQDFLSAFSYTLNYQRKRLTWTADDSGGRVERLSLVPRDGRYLVELPQGDRMVRFVPDSGSQSLVVFERDGVAPVRLVQTSAIAQMTSLTGARDVRLMVLEHLQVGGRAIRNQTTLVVSRDEPDAPAGDGLLPLHLFRSVSFDRDAQCLLVRW